MWTPSRGSNARRSGHRRIADYLADDQTTTTATDASDNESYTTAYGEEFFAAAAAGSGGAGGMLPAFLADQGDLVEVMLELDEESMVVRSVTPTSAALYGAASLPAPPSAAAAAEPGADHQGGALRLLAPDLRSELRRAAPDLLRHGGHQRGREDNEGGSTGADRAQRVGQQAGKAQGAGGGVRVAHHGGARPGEAWLH
uniref:Uncharacterized protein n=1 Tax=Zea mays TaxID=4577 RepID=C4JB58_MAIZE|nr:unknown [Zea mays]|eukprot:NP_001183822.1 uncharacterized protein LOC100502415 [Zea mays]